MVNLESRSPQCPGKPATGAAHPITSQTSANSRTHSAICVGRWDISRLLAALNQRKTLTRSRSTSPTYTMYRLTSSHPVMGAAVTRMLDCTSWTSVHQTLSLSLCNLMESNSTWRWTQGLQLSVISETTRVAIFP